LLEACEESGGKEITEGKHGPDWKLKEQKEETVTLEELLQREVVRLEDSIDEETDMISCDYED
jgi:hypothetical protein